MNEILDNKDFFNQLADYYDLMIPFADVVERKKKILESIVEPGSKFAVIDPVIDDIVITENRSGSSDRIPKR